MGKRIFIFIAVGVTLCLLSYAIHNQLIKNNPLSYSLKSVYLFHLLFSLCIYLLLAFLHAKGNKQVGFLFLFAIPLKAFCFFSFFGDVISFDKTINFTERMGLVIPMILFLLFEMVSIANILNEDN